MTDQAHHPARRTFAPVVAAGVGGGVLAAVASNNAWATGDTGLTHGAVTTAEAGVSPLAGALALVVLACWGVVLVTRGGFRRAVAWLGAVAALAYAVAVVWGRLTVADAVADDLARTLGDAAGPVHHTGWWWAALAAAVVVVGAGLAGVRFVRHWPEMGARYDAPGESGGAGENVPEDNLDIWKALDEGRDPTA